MTTIEAGKRAADRVAAQHLVRSCIAVMREVAQKEPKVRRDLNRYAKAAEDSARALWVDWDDE
jgi:hypothetical protein